jgi:hypothetical protein
VSKASEYVAALLEHKKRVAPTAPVYYRDGGKGSVLGEVCSSGQLSINQAAIISVADAIAFARWILDTFGEPEVSP